MLNQYCDPKGKVELREAIAEFYARFYGWKNCCAETMVTVGLGATGKIETIKKIGGTVLSFAFNNSFRAV